MSKKATIGYEKGAKFSGYMVKDYELQLNKTGGTTMGKERYGTAMQSAEDLNYGDLLTEAVTKYAERAN